MSLWIQEEISLYPQESSQIGHACADYSWDDRLLPPSSEKFPICTPSHWLIYSRKRKVQELHYLLSHSPNKESVVFHCKKLLLLQLSFGNHNLTYLFGALHCTPYLENPTTLLSDICSNFPFGHTKSKAWFHLTRAESQAAMMVSLPQGFDIGLFENSAILMLWLTQLAGRPIDIIPWCLKNNHSPWVFRVTHPKSYPLWSLF
jgi:hypothetical protein